MSEITINIGVSVRPDGRGTGHNWDRTALEAARQLFAKPIRMGRSEYTVKLNAIPVPKGFTGKYDEALSKMVVSDAEPLDPSDEGAVQRARATMRMEIDSEDIAGIDMLYIPGSAVATPTQSTDKYAMVATGRKTTEANSRDTFEKALIEKAMTRGIPVMAVCAGSWRLLESFGGCVRELTSTEVEKHHLFARDETSLSAKAKKEQAKRVREQAVSKYGENASVWSLSHQMRVHDGPGGAIRGSAQKTAIGIVGPADTAPDAGTAKKMAYKGENLVFNGVNTTHWAVASATQSTMSAPGKLAQRTYPGTVPASERRDPSILLDIVASDPDTGTVEGFETVHGVPMVGAQWHPEGLLDGQPGLKMDYTDEGTVGLSQNLFRYIILAAVAAKLKKQGVVNQLRGSLAEATSRLNKVKKSEKHYRENYEKLD